jgi:hypothetical protein
MFGILGWAILNKIWIKFNDNYKGIYLEINNLEVYLGRGFFSKN